MPPHRIFNRELLRLLTAMACPKKTNFFTSQIIRRTIYVGGLKYLPSIATKTSCWQAFVITKNNNLKNLKSLKWLQILVG